MSLHSDLAFRYLQCVCLTDNLESSHGIQIIVNKTHGIMNSIKEQVDWINTTQEQMKG